MTFRLSTETHDALRKKGKREKEQRGVTVETKTRWIDLSRYRFPLYACNPYRVETVGKYRVETVLWLSTCNKFKFGSKRDI